MINTKCLKAEPEAADGHRILVTRQWPRPRTKVSLALSEQWGWQKALAPSKELLDDWKQGTITWDEYTVRYHDEMGSQRELIEKLAAFSGEHTVTLLCFEADGDPHCHRHLLKALLDAARPRGVDRVHVSVSAEDNVARLCGEAVATVKT